MSSGVEETTSTYFGTNLWPSMYLMNSGLISFAENLADAGVLFDVGPFGDQKETLRVLGVAAQHAVLHLRR